LRLVLLRPVIMRCYLFSFATLVGIVFLCAQTPIILEAGPVSYTNIDGFVDDEYPLDIEDCSSIVYEVVYSFSLPWTGAPGNMEHNLECIAPACPGDPSDPQAPGCDNCWDFMDIQSKLDGITVDNETIGTVDNLNQFGTYSYGPICTDGANTASIAIRNQNNTTDETNTFSNVTIVCWEAAPEITTSSPICAGADLLLDGLVENINDVDTWLWSNSGAGNINDPASQFTFATDAEDGETYSLTTIDNNACTATAMESISAAAVFTAQLSGGGTTCINNCTDSSSDIVVQIMGGTGPYLTSFSVNGMTLTQSPSIGVNEVFRICIDDSSPLPFINDSVDPIVITTPSAFLPFDLTINNITDDTGCTGIIIDGSVTIEIALQPDIVAPTALSYCTQADGTIDLTQYDDDINGGDNSLDVIYYETADFDDEISNPSNYLPQVNSVCAVTYDGRCFSDFVCFGIEFNVQPIINNVMDIVDCSDDMYLLPAVGTIADISPVGSFQGYFADAAGTMGPLSLVPVTTTQLFLISEGTDPCLDVSVPVILDLTPNPVIDSPGNLLGGCGAVELPLPTGSNINSFDYNTVEDGSGTPYLAGDEITSADGIPTIFLIATNANGCTDILEITIDITSSVTYSAAIPTAICDSLVLPAITPTTPTVAYYTMTGGTGMAFAPGTVLQAPYNQTLFLFDPNQDPSCAAEVPVSVVINNSPMTTLPADTSACDFYILDNIPGTTNTPDYTLSPIVFPSSYRNVGDTIRNSTRIYILDTIGTCTLFDSLDINVVPSPNVGMETTIFACEGYSSSDLDLISIIGNPDTGGQWSYPTVPDFVPVDPQQIDISTFPIGSYDFTYAIEDPTCGINTATITLVVEPRPYAGEAMMVEVCNPQSLDFMALISDPETGGVWSQVPQDTFDFADSTQVDMSTLPTGQYIFLYLIAADGNSFCEGNSASLSIDIQNGPNAGDDLSTTECLGSTVNIRNLLSADADDDGMFFPNGFFLSGDEWITTGSPANQTYNVQYIIESTSAGCPSDTAFIDIFLAEDITAGEPATLPTICSGAIVDLADYIDNESTGGSYVLTQDYTTPVDNPLTVADSIDISYIVAAAGSCPSDTTDFSIDVTPAPTLTYTIDNNDLCADSGDCIEIEITMSATGPIDLILEGSSNNEFSFTQNVEADIPSTIIICAQGDFISGINDTIEINGDSEFYELSSLTFTDAQCGMITDTTISEIINLFPVFTEVIDTLICVGDSIEVNGVFYSSCINLSTSTTNGCDSTLQIIISNYPEAVNDIVGVFCTGTPIEVFGNILTRDTIATYVDPGASFFGCDSIVNVDIQFQDVAIGILDDVICDGMSITVGTEVFDENRTTDDVLLVGGSVAGCDSLVMVDLTYGSPNAETLAFDVCSGDMPIDVNGTLYGPNNLTGEETLTNTSGCDSTVTINLSLVPAIMELRDDNVCSSFSEEINGIVYDINNQMGTEMLKTASGCDSIINIDFNFILNIEVTRDEQVCGDYSEEINGNIYDISNPMGTEMLMTASGCDSTIIVDFNFVQSIVENRNGVFCETDSEVINGITYDIDNPSGIDTLTSVAGCDSIINIDFTFTIASATIEVNDICADVTEGSIEITDLQGLNLPIMVSINGGSVESFNDIPITLPVTAGNNDITIDDGNCMYQESISVVASSGPTSDIQQLVISATENQLSLVSDITPQNISWSSDIAGVTFSCLDCADPIVTSVESYTATVAYTDDNGCNYSEMISIENMPIVVGELYIPNIFDFNLAGENRFYIQTSNSSPPIIIDNMQIFDRWGNKVFEQINFLSNDSDSGWNGTRDGSIIEQGVYVYMIKYNDGERDNIRTGSITLIR